MNYTSVEQSKKLIELGLNPDSADMFYCYGMNTTTKEWGYDKEPSVNGTELHFDVGDVPCWSVGALIDLLPIGTHICSHITDAGTTYECYTEKERFECPSILDAVFSMIEWLLKIHWLDNTKF